MSAILAGTNAASSTAARILDAAEKAFAQGGFSGARLSPIADAVGIRRSSLLYHFPTKEKLYRATVARCFERMREALLLAMQSDGLFDRRVSATVRSFSEFLEREPSVAAIVLRELLDQGSSGRRIVLEQLRPVVDVVEAFARREGKGILRNDLPVRQAILQVASDVLLRSAANESREALWGTEDQSERLALMLFLPGEKDHVESR